MGEKQLYCFLENNTNYGLKIRRYGKIHRKMYQKKTGMSFLNSLDDESAK